MDPHHHASRSQDTGRAFALGVALNAAFVVVEAGFGFYADSLALLADAGHNLSDVLGLALAWGAAALARRPPGGRFTYGLRGSTIWAALANAMILLVAVGAIAWEALNRFGAPQPVAAEIVIWVALAGALVNGASAALFLRSRKHDLNARGAFLHMAADAAISLGVAIAGVAILWSGWGWLDSAVSLVIAAFIVAGTWGLMREALALALHSAPREIELPAVRAQLEALPGVTGVHDLHVWAMSTTEIALTAHLMIPSGHPGDAFLASAAHALEARFRIGHATLQIERGDGAAPCHLAPDDVV
ncbi:MAG: cobalt transporter [Betaproteobacteria bacterium RIFCSPLOWO2_02_FULL_66_14]|nr:MAG: cobalt transporter [Betaproteobacteria bacterium RIFCSPLOWO2_02_FULL_66_14]